MTTAVFGELKHLVYFAFVKKQTKTKTKTHSIAYALYVSQCIYLQLLGEELLFF